MDNVTRGRLIRVAQGIQPADLVFKGADILNVFTGELMRGDLAIKDGYIAGIGAYDRAERVVDASGKTIVPGFINTHCHVESSMVTPFAYCMEELAHGVTTLITDPHEIANVAGNEGIRYMMEAAAHAPVNYYVQLPSCVPATPFEHAGAVLDAHALVPMLSDLRVLGLGEMMDYAGVLGCNDGTLAKLAIAEGCVIDGHAPSLTGRELQAYAAAGIHTDHESTTFAEALEKLRAGMAVLIREGSASKNLDAIVGGMIEHGIQANNIAFCSDDKHIADIRREGTILRCIRRAIELGMEPARAYAIATINAARIYRLHDLGAIAPGYRADLVMLGDWRSVDIARVYKDGVPMDRNHVRSGKRTPSGSVHIAPMGADSLALPELYGDAFPVIGVRKHQILTEKRLVSKAEIPSRLAAQELCKIAVIERHHATGSIGVGLLEGYGLKNGAIASTVAHDSHNLIVIGTNDHDMLLAVEKIREIQGGYVLVQGGKVSGFVSLPVYGLMSDQEPEAFIPAVEQLIAQAYAAGVDPDIDPFITLSFMALPVLPEIRVTDMGIFDVVKFQLLK